MAGPQTRKRQPPTRRVGNDASPSSTIDTCSSESESSERPVKRRRLTKKTRPVTKPWKDVLSADKGVDYPSAVPPTRTHVIAYHRPLLLDHRASRDGLLAWFDGVSSSRLMPWRKPWIDPRTWDDQNSLRAALERRAYEVWISEIMLQQTRVSVVIDYWKRWMAKWPTIQDLAAADSGEVLSAWRGLGYYSRATRIYEAAQLVVNDTSLQGLLPSDAGELKAKVPGIGRYTAGAISAIVFGHPEAMVDGNVIRVLSRQMGLYADFKTSKTAMDLIWDAADRLAKTVALDMRGDGTDSSTSDRPGRWGQALMELGSTLCTPTPDCARCPVTATCRAFGEGVVLAKPLPGIPPSPDIEDLCALCEPMEGTLSGEASEAGKRQKRIPSRREKIVKVQNGTLTGVTSDTTAPPLNTLDQPTLDVVVDYAKRFPVKGMKKPVRTEEALVCAIRWGDLYLIQKRPSKGLLAGMWELPSHAIPEGSKTTVPARKRMAQTYVSGLLKDLSNPSSRARLQVKHVGELGSVPWQFSHFKLTMHVHLFDLEQPSGAGPQPQGQSRWAPSPEVEQESMGTGMRKCWAMVSSSSL